jgi:hypothetical protein
MSDRARWALVVVLVACVLGLIAWARGTDHHHGQDVGAERSSYTSSSTLRG